MALAFLHSLSHYPLQMRQCAHWNFDDLTFTSKAVILEKNLLRIKSKLFHNTEKC